MANAEEMRLTRKQSNPTSRSLQGYSRLGPKSEGSEYVLHSTTTFHLCVIGCELGCRFPSWQAKEGYLQGQIGNPDGEEKPNKKFYDPRVWIRKVHGVSLLVLEPMCYNIRTGGACSLRSRSLFALYSQA